MAFEKEVEELLRRKEKNMQMGGPEKVQRQHEEGRLTARERIDRLVDPGTFTEVGLLNHSDMPGTEDRTPADSKVAGFARVDGRRVAVTAYDFTVMSGSTSRVAMRKEAEVLDYAVKKGFPMIVFSESGGARMPDIMGSQGLAGMGGGTSLTEHRSEARNVPRICGLMGQCFGAGAWAACYADFVVMVKGATLSVSGPRVLELALGEEITNEELGGWRIHSEITGHADRVAEDEDECIGLMKQFLSYMPDNAFQSPERKPVPEDSAKDMPDILDILPEERNRGYDMHRIIECIADKESVFPVKPAFGKNTITCLARLNGMVVGFVANNPMFGAGAMDTKGIDKVTSFLCLCDSYNIPIITLHDTPGFLVGKEAEKNKVAGKIINYFRAVGMLSVPKISIIVRKSYGQAFFNMIGTGCGADFLAAWPTAEISFIAPETAANVVYGGKPDHELKQQEMIQKMVLDSSPYPAAGLGYLSDIIDPGTTRDYITKCLEFAADSDGGFVGRHRLKNWPTKF